MNKIELPVEVKIAILVAITNYKNRIAYLEKEKRISSYKLNRIKSTTLYDLDKGEKILQQSIENV